jgi:hypothetical protein
MQLRTGRLRIARLRPHLLFTVLVLVATTVQINSAHGADPKESGTGRKEPSKDVDTSDSDPRDTSQETKLEDTATERVGAEFAVYDDSDHVTVITPSIHASIENASGASLSGNYLVDVVSAASADIVSTASTRWQEVRQAGAMSGKYKPHDFGVGAGGSISSEPDYLSFGAYAMIMADFDQKNWTATFGYGFSHDTAGRCGTGGACTPFSIFSRNLQRGSFNAGIAWVVDRESLASATMDLIIENGDQSKPYRYIPMFSPQVAALVPLGASIDFVNANRLPERPLEQLPLSRTRFALTGRYAHRLEGSTLRVEERLYDDSWGLVASTTDGKWIFDLGRRFAFWPHARLHVQSATSFWQRAYVSQSTFGWDLPRYRTGDRELGPLSTIDGGLGLRWYLGSDAQPYGWQVGFTVDAMYTSFADDLYVVSRTAFLGASSLEAGW